MYRLDASNKTLDLIQEVQSKSDLWDFGFGPGSELWAVTVEEPHFELFNYSEGGKFVAAEKEFESGLTTDIRDFLAGKDQ